MLPEYLIFKSHQDDKIMSKFLAKIEFLTSVAGLLSNIYDKFVFFFRHCFSCFVRNTEIRSTGSKKKTPGFFFLSFIYSLFFIKNSIKTFKKKTLFATHTHTLSVSLSLSLSHEQSHTHTRTHFLYLFLFLYVCLFVTHTHTHTHTLSFFRTFSIAHTDTHTHTHTHTHSLSLSLSLSLYLSIYISIYLTQIHTFILFYPLSLSFSHTAHTYL